MSRVLLMCTAHTVDYYYFFGGGGTNSIPVWTLKKYASWLTYISVNKHAKILAFLQVSK